MKKLSLLILSIILFFSPLLASAQIDVKSGINYYLGEDLKEDYFDSKTDVKAFIESLPDDLAIKANAKYYRINFMYRDDGSQIHYVLSPIIDGIQLIDYMILIHTDEEGNVTSINGELDRPMIKVTNQLIIPDNLAIQLALESIGEKPELIDYKYDSPLAIYVKYTIDVELMKKVYRVTIENQETMREMEVTIDAEDGQVLKTREVTSATSHKSYLAKGTGTYNKKYVLEATKIQDQVYLFSNINGTPIRTYVMNPKTLGFQIAQDDDGEFNDPQQAHIVQGHHNMSEVIRFFQKEFDWYSFDGNQSPVEIVIDYTDNGDPLDNAFWDGQRFVFGVGEENLSKNNVLALDIVAHEFMHAVTENTASLVYENQSGALDESLSDVFGFFLDPEDYTIGEDLLIQGADESLVMRSLKSPSKYGQPEHMDQFEVTDNNLEGDFGSVHLNNGIPNKAAYEIIERIGVEKAKQLYFYTVTNYLFPYAEFSDMKVALFLSATFLYGNNSIEAQAVLDSWEIVGVN